MDEEIKKEIAELKEIVSKLLELQMYEHQMKYGYMDNIKNLICDNHTNKTGLRKVTEI